jgi:hypothetical protein
MTAGLHGFHFTGLDSLRDGLSRLLPLQPP